MKATLDANIARKSAAFQAGYYHTMKCAGMDLEDVIPAAGAVGGSLAGGLLGMGLTYGLGRKFEQPARRALSVLPRGARALAGISTVLGGGALGGLGGAYGGGMLGGEERARSAATGGLTGGLLGGAIAAPVGPALARGARTGPRALGALLTGAAGAALGGVTGAGAGGAGIKTSSLQWRGLPRELLSPLGLAYNSAAAAGNKVKELAAQRQINAAARDMNQVLTDWNVDTRVLPEMSEAGDHIYTGEHPHDILRQRFQRIMDTTHDWIDENSPDGQLGLQWWREGSDNLYSDFYNAIQPKSQAMRDANFAKGSGEWRGRAALQVAKDDALRTALMGAGSYGAYRALNEE